MHQIERIALWSIIVLIVLFLFFRGRVSGFGPQDNLMSLAEFNNVPKEFKDLYISSALPITSAIGNKLADDLKHSDKDKTLAFMGRASILSKEIVNNINKSPNFLAAIDPSTHKDSIDKHLLNGNASVTNHSSNCRAGGQPWKQGGPPCCSNKMDSQHTCV